MAGKGENRNLYPAVRPVAVSCASARTLGWSRTVRGEKELSLREWLLEKQSFRIGPLFLLIINLR